ncbi:MAG: hypothetical protein ABIX01_18720 [Chitinophagaceae bacterium]
MAFAIFKAIAIAFIATVFRAYPRRKPAGAGLSTASPRPESPGAVGFSFQSLTLPLSILSFHPEEPCKGSLHRSMSDAFARTEFCEDS